ncbi:MAG: LuxR C-terminal-related transcriptional regulator [Acidobacteriota bacterium]
MFLDEGAEVMEMISQLRHLAPAFVGNLQEAFSKEQLLASSKSQKVLIEPLSKTQLAILRLVAEGLSNRDIATRLTITEGTTKWHLNQIFGKLNVASRTQAVAQARQFNLF